MEFDPKEEKEVEIIIIKKFEKLMGLLFFFAADSRNLYQLVANIQ